MKSSEKIEIRFKNVFKFVCSSFYISWIILSAIYSKKSQVFDIVVKKSIYQRRSYKSYFRIISENCMAGEQHKRVKCRNFKVSWNIGILTTWASWLTGDYLRRASPTWFLTKFTLWRTHVLCLYMTCGVASSITDWDIFIYWYPAQLMFSFESIRFKWFVHKQS